MGKKDATGQRAAPMDHYRKQIGKHDYNKEKKKLKSSKASSDLKRSSSAIQDTMLVMVTGVLFVALLYFGLYWYLNKDKL